MAGAAVAAEASSLCAALCSSRVLERRRARHQLQLRVHALAPHLAALLRTLHQALLKDLEKTADDVDSSYSSLLRNIVSEANLSKHYIDCKTLLEYTDEILKCNRFARAIGNTYISILDKHVLCVQFYLERITPCQWADLLDIIIDRCESCDVNYSDATRLLVRIIKEGLSRCHLILPIRDRLSSIQSLYASERNDKKDNLQENLIEVAILITENISPECRLTVCIFTETIIPHVLKFYERTTVSNKTGKKMLLFQFLKLSILVHHPKGEFDANSGCLMGDANSWNYSLRLIHQLVTAESRLINEHRKKNYSSSRSNETDADVEFIKLAVELSHQIFKGDVRLHSDEDNLESTSKRSRCDTYDFSSLEQVLNCLPDYVYPWIKIINNYISKYGANLTVDENCSILDTLYKLSMSDILDVEQNLLFDTISCFYENIIRQNWNKQYEELTLKMWTVLFRKASIQSNVSNTCHNAINVLLRLKEFHLPVENFLAFYSDQTMPYSYESILNLNVLLTEHNSKLNDDKMRMNVTKWTLSNYSSSKSDESISEILFKLCVKEIVPLHINKPKMFDVFENIFEDPESFMLISDFEMNLLIEKRDDDINIAPADSIFTVRNNIYDAILKTLAENILNKITMFKNANKFAQNILIDIHVTLKFISHFVERNIISFDKFKDTTVIIIGAMDILNAYISTYFNNASQGSDEKIDFLSNLKSLYDIGYHSEVGAFIRDKTYKEILESLCMILNKGDDQTDGDVFQSEITEISNADLRYKKLALETILHYNLEKSRYSIKMLKFILNDELYDFNDKNDLYIAIDAIEFITKNFKKDVVPINDIVKFMQAMCIIVSRDSDATYKLLSVLYNIFTIIGPNDTSTVMENNLIMLQGFLRKCTSHYYTPKTMGIALKCLCCALIYCNVQNHREINRNILFKGLCSNLHSIRIYSCYCISMYISKVSPGDFRELCSIWDDVFTLDAADLSNSVKKDEGANRTSAVLHCLASISISSSVFDKKSLSTIIKLAHDKNISLVLLKKVFCLMAKFLEIPLNAMILNNISFLLTSWYKANLPIDKFPWSLSEHESFEEFIDAFKHVIIPMEFFWMKNNERKIIIDTLIQNNNVLLNKLIIEYIPDLLILYISSADSNHFTSNILDLKSKLEVKFNQEMPADEVLKIQFKSNVDYVLYGIILLVYDQVIFEDIEWSGYLPYVIVPVLSYDKFESVIRYLKELYQGDFIADLCNNHPDKIKEIFLKLWSEIETHYTLERKLLSLGQYSVFCNLLPVDTKLNTYIYYFIINSLLSLIKMYSDHKSYYLLSKSACKILYKILKKILPKLSDLLNNLLSSIVSTLSKFALKEYNINSNDSLDVLKFLLIDMKDCFKDSIKILDPLPKLDIFNRIDRDMQNDSVIMYYPLKEQIDNFICGDIVDRYEGLNSLYQILISNRKELIDMYDNLKDIQGSRSRFASNLHQLTFTLIKIMSNSNDENSCLQASRCLGELGPSNLQTLILKYSSDIDKIDKPLECFIRVLFNEIKNLIFDENPVVMKAVSTGLISILTFMEGVVVLESLIDSSELLKNLMLPFLPKKNRYLSTNLKIIGPMFDANLDCAELWYDFDSKKHSEWVVDIVKAILKCFSEQQCFLLNLMDICGLKATVSEKCFAPLIGLILSIANENQINTISTHVKLFFNYYFEKTYTMKNDNNDDDVFTKEFNRDFDKESVNCMLQLVQFIRLQMTSYQWIKQKENFTTSNVLNLDYLSIAWAAYLNGSYFMSIFYCELWCTYAMNGIPPYNPELIANIPQGEDMLKIMRLCYIFIGDDDALSGCGFSHYSNPVERRNHFMSTRSYIDALHMHDMSLSNQNSMFRDPSAKDFASSLFKSGLYHTTNRYIQSFDSDNLFDDIKYECYWRLSNWNLDVDSHSCKSNDLSCDDSMSLAKSNSLWSVHQYKCLKRTLDRDISSVDFTCSNHLKDARLYIAQKYSFDAMENCQSAYYLGAKCQILQEIEYFTEMVIEKKGVDVRNLIERWSADNILPFANFKNIEPILSQRVVMLDYVMKNSIDTDTKASIAKLQLKYAELAAFHGWSHISNRWINNASQIVLGLSSSDLDNTISESLMKKLRCLVTLAEGSAAWNSGHQDLAIHLVKSVISQGDVVGNDSYAKALMMYGSWMVETRQESPPDILSKYLQLSLDVLESDNENSDKIDTYLIIARFCDGEYKQMDTYMKSANFVNQLNRMKRCTENYTSLKEKSTQAAALSRDQRKAMHFNDRQFRLDTVEINNIKVERQQYLRYAINFYLLTLQNGDKYDHCVFRMISLWLNNPLCELNEFLDKSSVPIFQTIPSRKFLPLLPQLGPRLGNGKYDQSFQNHLQNLLKTCAVQHPHHTLPILLALKNSQLDLTENGTDNKDKAYTIIAKKLLKSIILEGQGKLPNIIKEMDTLCLAMINLANLKTEPKHDKIRIPRTHSLQSLKKLPHVLIPTVNLPVNHEQNYENIPSIYLLSDDFTLVGGMNAPKKLSCRGSDGFEYNMLLKCDDDIRQDAVMQQVFGVVNNLLEENHQTKQRRLLIRTYKIVVLSHRSGLLEWCNGTESFGCILTGPDGRKGYYSKYRSSDLAAKSAREQLAAKTRSTNDEKLKVYKMIVSKVKPVFHLFFTENFLCPAIWYERKLAYTQSVATSSMTGYILGIGDRHVQNILIDKSTAEVIHIDFGIAFEQGKLQPTPETVPFRLTQNMVAGFGCTGVEGIFKKCCEKTMDVLKSNQETLLTILEVLLCDPLYIWTISDGQNSEKHSSGSDCDSEEDISSSVGEAQRVLIRVRSKLEGSEFGRTLATSGQVARLVQEATDINNLSRLFHGWQPYL